MASTSGKPTIVLIPGSFSKPTIYDSLAAELKSLGYETETVTLPTVGTTTPLTANDDAAHIQSLLSTLTSSGKDVVLVMHSYGGVPGTESVRGFAKSSPGQSGCGVIALVYVAAMLIQPGASLASTQGDTGPPPSWLSVDPTTGTMTLDALEAAKLTFSDLPPTELEKYTSFFSTHSGASFATELSYPAYRHVPATYVLAEEDRVIPPDLQRSMVEAARVDNDLGIRIEALKGSGHAPNVTRVGEVARIIVEAAVGGQ